MKFLHRSLLIAGILTLVLFFTLNTRFPIKMMKTWSKSIKWKHTEFAKRAPNRATSEMQFPEVLQRDAHRLHVPQFSVESKTKVDIESLLQEAHEKVECEEVIKNPRSFWKSQNWKSKFTAAQDITRMRTALRCGVLDEEFLTTPPQTFLYPFEKWHLAQPPATSLGELTSPKHTHVDLVTDTNTTVVQVGDQVTVLVQARNVSGGTKNVGGDEVRVWFVDVPKSNVITADVTDLGSGTYMARTVLRWPGKFSVKVAIAYPREYLRCLLHIHRVYKHTRLSVGHFANTKADETTPCYHAPVIPGGYTRLCDLTKNTGSPWYCGHPVKRELTCGDFKGSHHGQFDKMGILPLTPAQFKIFHLRNSIDASNTIMSPVTVTVVAPDKQQYPRPCGGSNPCPLCNAVRGRETWDVPQSTGYLYDSVWHPQHCRAYSFRPTREQCFKDTEWVLLGDSNLRSHYNVFSKEAGAVDVVTTKAGTVAWPNVTLVTACESKSLNFSMRWYPDPEPFLNGAKMAWSSSLTPSTSVVDKLSSYRRYVIILNNCYHTAACHFSSIHSKLLAVKDALVRFFRRNKHSIAALQGPHIAWAGWPEDSGPGDVLGRHVIELEHQVFSEPALRDRVLYIPAWDITQALENRQHQPENMRVITRLLQSYVCGRSLDSGYYLD